jgi:hypothetical protein
MITNMNATQMDHIKHSVDMAAVVAAVWSVAGWLPPVAALFSIVWLGMQIIMNWSKFTAALRRMFT